MSYQPPPVRESFTSPVDIGVDGMRLFWRQDLYKGLVVDFCIELQFLVDVEPERDQEWCTVFRVDTSHSEVHHHQEYASGKPGRRQVDQEIPDKGWETVDNAWDFWLDHMMDEYETYRERWERG